MVGTSVGVHPLPCFVRSLATNPMKLYQNLRSRSAWLGAAAFALTAAHSPAQPAASTSSPVSAQEALKLSPFEVKDTEGSYTSTMTSSGTRVRADIRELPFSVGIVTADFIKDFVAFSDYKDSLAYTSGVVSRGNYNQAYYVRGLQNDGQLRNGFFRAGMFDAVNVDRIEVIKGPNAGIYGRSSPGGAINVVTKMPTPHWNSSVSARVGANDFQRFEFGLSGPLIADKLLFRLDAAKQDEQFYYDFEEQHLTTVSGVLQYRFGSGAKLIFEADWLDKLLYAPGAQTMFRRVGGVITNTLAEELGSFNPRSPTSENNRSLNSLNLTFEHQLARNIQVRATAHSSERPTPSWTNSGDTFYTVETRTVANRRTQLEDNTTQYKAFQSDLLVDFDVGPTQHKLLATFDYAKDESRNERWRVAQGDRNNPIYNIGTLSVDNPNYFIADKPLLRDFFRNDASSGTDKAVFASDRIYFADKRGLFLVGARQNWSTSSSEDYLTGAKGGEDRDAMTYQIGLNWKVADPVTVYANYSTSYRVNSGVDSKGNPWENQKGKGAEAGFKAEFLDRKLNVTAAYFDITRFNVLRTNPVTTLQELTGEENSKGFEVDFHYQATGEWLLFGQYTNLKARIAADVQDRTLVGFQLPFVPDVTWAVATRYDVRRGKAKGLNATLGYKYFGEITTSTAATPYQRSYRQAAYAQLDASVGYGWKTGKHLGHRVTVNLRNVLDEDYYFGDRVKALGFGVIASYTLSYK